MSGNLRMELLGKRQISLDGEALHVEQISQKGQSLLIYLAVTGKSVGRASLATLFWGEMGDERAKANLRLALAQMRQSLAAYLVIDRQSVAFNMDQPHWLDVAEFQANASLPEKCDRNKLKRAIALYRGDFLAGFELLDAPNFEEWLRIEQERLRKIASNALSFLVEEARRQGEFSEGIAYARRQIELEPWREESHQQLMRLLAAGGQRSEALAQYQICRRVLAAELDVEPTQETVQLYELIRRQSTALSLERSAPQPTSFPHATPITSSFYSNLPAHLTPLVGREAELTQIALLLDNPECHLLTLIGPGGIGKTRLAIAAAEAQSINYAGNYEDGICFVSLVGVDPAGVDNASDLLISTIANVLNYDFSAQRPPRELLLDHLMGKAMLLLLDNFEQLTEAAELLVEIVKRAPKLKVLVTSRVRLGIESEWLFDVEGLAYPTVNEKAGLGSEPNEPTRVQDNAAARLFEQVAQRSRSDFSLAAEEVNVNHICNLVAGLPLAIELAANWVRSLSCAEIVTRLEGSRGEASSPALDILATTTTIVAQRHQNMRAVLSHSWELLSEEAQETFRRTSIFRGGFALEAAEKAMDVSFARLATLVDQSWLRCDADGRYRLHELLRQFGTEQLALHGDEQKQVLHKHCAYYANFLALHSAGLDEAVERSAVRELDQEIENIRALWEVLLAQQEVESIAAYLEGLWRYYQVKGWFQEVVALMGQACNLDIAPPLLKARWQHWWGEAHYQMGHHAQSRLHFEAAMELLGHPVPKTAQGWEKTLLAQIARQARHRLLPIATIAPSPQERLVLVETARILTRIGQIYFFSEEKVPCLTAAIYEVNLSEEASLTSEVARGYALTALIITSSPLKRLAPYYAQRCKQTLDKVDRVATKAYVLEVMGVYEMGIGDWQASAQHLEKSAILLTRIGMRRWWEETRLLQALVDYHQGRFQQSVERFEEARRSARHRNDPLALFWSLLGIVECSLRLKEQTSADLFDLLDEAKALPEKYLGRAEMVRYYGVLALAHLERGDMESAWQAAQETARRINDASFWMFWSYEGYTAPAEIALHLWERCAGGEKSVIEAENLAQAARAGCKALNTFAATYAPGQPRAWLYQGRYQWLTGNTDKAQRFWNNALALADSLSMPYEQAYAHLEIGRHLAEGDPQRHLHLQRATEIIATLGINQPTPA